MCYLRHDCVVHTCPIKLAKERLTAVFGIRKLSQELQQQEDELKATMHPDVRRCVATILLFERLLKQLQYWDMEVVDLLKYGVPLVGLQEPPCGYQKFLVHATLTEEELMASSQWRSCGSNRSLCDAFQIA